MLNSLLTERQAFFVDVRIKNVVRVLNHWYWLIHRSRSGYAEGAKRRGNEKPGDSLFQNAFNGNVREIAHQH